MDEKIRNARFGRWYKFVRSEGVPEYLNEDWGESRWQREKRFRLRGEMRGAKYWEREEKRRCRVCGYEEETWEHVWERCSGSLGEGGWQENVKEILGAEGKKEG